MVKQRSIEQNQHEQSNINKHTNNNIIKNLKNLYFLHRIYRIWSFANCLEFDNSQNLKTIFS